MCLCLVHKTCVQLKPRMSGRTHAGPLTYPGLSEHGLLLYDGLVIYGFTLNRCLYCVEIELDVSFQVVLGKDNSL